MNCDLLMQWSIFCDYPIFRMHMKRYFEKRFNKILFYPSNHNRDHSFRPFLEKVIDDKHWLKPEPINWTEPGIDWRQSETIPLIEASDSEWIFITEPDFFCKDWDIFLNMVEDEMKTANMIGWMNMTNFHYIHPSCFFIKRSMLEKTSKDFRAHPEVGGSDHFATVTRDVEKVGGKIVTLKEMGLIDWEDFFHLGGLTQNYIEMNENPETYDSFVRPELFYIYNYWSRKADVEQSPEYLTLSKAVERKLLDTKGITINPEENKWSIFFK